MDQVFITLFVALQFESEGCTGIGSFPQGNLKSQAPLAKQHPLLQCIQHSRVSGARIASCTACIESCILHIFCLIMPSLSVARAVALHCGLSRLLE
eukprot:6234576-Amphidinium_carterae.1